MRGSSKENGHGEARHGQRQPEWRAWESMVYRCSHRRFKHYAGRGISVCAEWQGGGGYLAFLAHVGRRPTPAHSLDRIDNDGNYEPGNVRWATQKQQARNRRPRQTSRNNRVLTVSGKTQCLREWAEEVGNNAHMIEARLSRGWDTERAIFQPKAQTTVIKPGMRFGFWTVLKKDPTAEYNSRFFCRCDCGNRCIVGRSNIISGASTRCMRCSNVGKEKRRNTDGQYTSTSRP